MQINDRRRWLKQSALALAGLGLSPTLFAKSVDRSVIYKPADAILLGSNENPYGPSPAARKAMLENYLSSNRYPDDMVVDLKKAIAAHWGVGTEHILLGAGSSEIIGLACLHASKLKGHVISTHPSYQEWNTQASAFGLSFKRNPLPKNGTTDIEKLYGPVTADTSLVYICNPNNPTGSVLDIKLVEQFAVNASKQTLVFIDEAYTEYAGMDSLARLAITNPRIIVAKTFSKIYGMAGARIGYAIAHPKTIQALSNYQPWPDANVSTVSTAAAIASLTDRSFVEECREKNNKAKELCYSILKQLNLEYIPSSANFILFNIDRLKEKFNPAMKNKNIHLRFRDAYGGKWCRVTMGTPEEMQSFTNVLKEIAL
jgi:histidinol-phosphate aminotransferase